MPEHYDVVVVRTRAGGAPFLPREMQNWDSELAHADGVSPAWPLSYDDFEPYYPKAEWLYQVRPNAVTDFPGSTDA
jgi:choline dehydrogenase-like flavoprotein